jgi:hypothetical protein
MGLLRPNVAKLEAKGDTAGLVKAAHHDDNLVKDAAFAALARQGSAAVTPLFSVLTGATETESERYLAATSLGKIGSEAAARALVEAIAVLGPRFGWTAETGYLDDFVLQGITDGLRKIGPSGVQPIVEVFPGHPLRGRLAAVLGSTRDPRAVEPLAETLRGPDTTPQLSRAACEALAALAEAPDAAIEMERRGTADALGAVLGAAQERGDADTAGWALSALRALQTAGVARPTGVTGLGEAEEGLVEIARRTVPPAEGLTHFFVCSPNASLIEAFDGLFRVGAPAYGGSAARLHTTSASLDERRRVAVAGAPPFAGRSLMLTTEKDLDDVAALLASLGAQSGSDGLWIAYVAVGPEGRAWVRQVYDELIRQAIPQGILPFPMVSTEAPDAARFLLDSCERA